jgi:hypothetical protein
MFNGAYPVMGLGLWQGRGIIGESRALNKPSGAQRHSEAMSGMQCKFSRRTDLKTLRYNCKNR